MFYIGIQPSIEYVTNEKGQNVMIEIWDINKFDKKAVTEGVRTVCKEYGAHRLRQFHINTRSEICRGALGGHFTLDETRKLLKTLRKATFFLIESERWEAYAEDMEFLKKLESRQK